ncbi:MAG: hypothetical protein JWM80_4381 [Cyanobacteria bacterium RYN_339]|nr:hypothetical protein [Cyanobacteria bacterium RYN_339]
MLCLVLACALSGCWSTQQHGPQHDPDAGQPGYPDADLPQFAPAEKGMMSWSSRNYDQAGKPVGQELEELDDFEEASAGKPATRTYKVVDDEEGGPSQISHFKAEIFPDRIQGTTEESGRFTILLKTPLKPGTTWTYPRGGSAGGGQRSIVAIEDVCTTYGFFPKAVKVIGTTIGSRPSGGEPLRTRTEEWFVKGVGRVQVIARVEGKPELVLRSVLESYINPALDEPFAPPSCQPR